MTIRPTITILITSTLAVVWYPANKVCAFVAPGADRFRLHGGIIWGVGNSLNLIAAGKAGAAVSYGLGQGATLVAALWGVFIWKEFKNAKREVSVLIAIMLMLFLAGIISIIYAGQ